MHNASLKRALSLAASTVFAALLCGVALADCAQPPDIRATVKVRSCVAVTFGASDVSMDSYAPNSREYEAGAKVSGTLLSVEVVTSDIRGGDPRARNYYLQTWSKGHSLNLFVSDPPARACPAVLYGTETVTVIPDCCDVYPLKGLCLVPDSIVRVELNRGRK